MRYKIILIIFVTAMANVSCSQLFPDSAAVSSDSTSTQASAGTATAMMDEVRREFMSGQTATAAVEKAVEEALTTAVAAAVAETLTAVITSPLDDQQMLASPTRTPFYSSTPLPSDTPQIPATMTQPTFPTTTKSLSCYQVIDSWCTTHQGCSTVDVRNQSGLDSNWHIWSDKNAVNATFIIPPGICTLVTRPGRYNFHVNYCDGEVADFSWQLNDKWFYKISPCD